MSESIRFTKFSVEERLPALGVAVLTENKEGRRHVAMRVDSLVEKGTYMWALIRDKYGIGRIYDVVSWFEEAKPETAQPETAALAVTPAPDTAEVVGDDKK